MSCLSMPPLNKKTRGMKSETSRKSPKNSMHVQDSFFVRGRRESISNHPPQEIKSERVDLPVVYRFPIYSVRMEVESRACVCVRRLDASRCTHEEPDSLKLAALEKKKTRNPTNWSQLHLTVLYWDLTAAARLVPGNSKLRLTSLFFSGFCWGFWLLSLCLRKRKAGHQEEQGVWLWKK